MKRVILLFIFLPVYLFSQKAVEVKFIFDGNGRMLQDGQNEIVRAIENSRRVRIVFEIIHPHPFLTYNLYQTYSNYDNRNFSQVNLLDSTSNNKIVFLRNQHTNSLTAEIPELITGRQINSLNFMITFKEKDLREEARFQFFHIHRNFKPKTPLDTHINKYVNKYNLLRNDTASDSAQFAKFINDNLKDKILGNNQKLISKYDKEIAEYKAEISKNKILQSHIIQNTVSAKKTYLNAITAYADNLPIFETKVDSSAIATLLDNLDSSAFLSYCFPINDSLIPLYLSDSKQIEYQNVLKVNKEKHDTLYHVKSYQQFKIKVISEPYLTILSNNYNNYKKIKVKNDTLNQKIKDTESKKKNKICDIIKEHSKYDFVAHFGNILLDQSRQYLLFNTVNTKNGTSINQVNNLNNLYVNSRIGIKIQNLQVKNSAFVSDLQISINDEIIDYLGEKTPSIRNIDQTNISSARYDSLGKKKDSMIYLPEFSYLLSLPEKFVISSNIYTNQFNTIDYDLRFATQPIVKITSKSIPFKKEKEGENKESSENKSSTANPPNELISIKLGAIKRKYRFVFTTGAVADSWWQTVYYKEKNNYASNYLLRSKQENRWAVHPVLFFGIYPIAQDVTKPLFEKGSEHEGRPFARYMKNMLKTFSFNIGIPIDQSIGKKYFFGGSFELLRHFNLNFGMSMQTGHYAILDETIYNYSSPNIDLNNEMLYRKTVALGVYFGLTFNFNIFYKVNFNLSKVKKEKELINQFNTNSNTRNAENNEDKND